MIEFDPKNPFPLLASGSYTYREAQEHARKADEWLGLQTEKTENSLNLSSSGHQLWLDLPIQTMLTPYVEIREILSHFDVDRSLTVIDLGSAYGRMGFVIGRHFENWKFIGYEFVKERVEQAEDCIDPKVKGRVRNIVADLSSEEMCPEAGDVFFIYDYGNRAAIQKTLLDLQAFAMKKPITVVGRGRASRDAIEREHPWLSQVVPPQHFAHYSIYRSA